MLLTTVNSVKVRILLTLLLLLLQQTTLEAKKRIRNIEYPRMGWRNTRSLEINRISLSDTATVLWFDVFNTGDETFSIGKDACIRVGGKDLAARSANGIVFDQEMRIPDEGKNSFSIVFPPHRSANGTVGFQGK